MIRFNEKFRNDVSARLNLMMRRAIAEEISDKFKPTKYVKTSLKIREYPNLHDFLVDRIAYNEEVIAMFLAKENTYQDVVILSETITNAIVGELANIGFELKPPMLSSIRYIIFGHLLNLMNAWSNFRYLVGGETYKELLKYLKKIGIKHPDEI